MHDAGRQSDRVAGRRSRGALLVAFLALAACGDARTSADAGRDARALLPGQAADTTIRIFFSRADSAVPVRRVIRADSAGLEASVRLLLRGPTAAERENGLTSWFSERTAGALRSAEVGADGVAVLDFENLRSLIPNASSSAGSAMLLRELNATVFEDPSVRSVEYRMAGSCAEFHEWLQYECRTVGRP